MHAILADAETARTAFLELADRDATAFDGVMAAFKMPKETDAEKAVRSQAIQQGYEAAAEVPLEIARRAAELMELARETTEMGNANAASDGACAAQALSASVWSATYNVDINAAALKDQAKATALRDEVSALLASAHALLDATDAAFGSRLG
jgi:methenyltetrahydrofolate cyclohydrolase